MRLNKINHLKNGNKLIAYWANNAGRGGSNCTLYVIAPDVERAGNCRLQEQKPFISSAVTSSWRGDVNASKSVLRVLGIEKSAIVPPVVNSIL